MSAVLAKTDEVEIGKLICKATKAFFENAENRAAFEKWFLEQYGIPYVWKKVSENA